MLSEFETTTEAFFPRGQPFGLRLYAILLPIFGIIGIILNSLVVYSSGLLIEMRKIIKIFWAFIIFLNNKGQHPRSCYMIMGNLGLSNLCMSITVIFGHYYPSRNDVSCAFQIGMIFRFYQKRNSFLYKFLGMVVSTSLVAIYSVLLVAIDRFLYILRGLQYQQYMYPNRVRLLSFISWTISISVGFLPLIPSLRGRMNADKCWFILLNPELVLTTTLIGIIIQLKNLTFLYVISLRYDSNTYHFYPLWNHFA